LGKFLPNFKNLKIGGKNKKHKTKNKNKKTLPITLKKHLRLEESISESSVKLGGYLAPVS